MLARIALAVTLLIGLLSARPSLASADAGSPWLPGPGAVGDDTFVGFIDAPANGAQFTPNLNVEVRGWVADQNAISGSGVDDVQVYLGLQDQGGTLMNHAQIGLKRDDVVAAFGNPTWSTSGFDTAFSAASLGVGSNTLSVYVHSPDKGWWYRQLSVTVPAAPDRPFADDPLLIVREAAPSLDVAQSTHNLILRGYAIDRNLPTNLQLGVGGSGVSSVQAYLDGPRNAGNGAGTLIASATLGEQNREATGFGQRFVLSGWELTLHPTDLSVDRHELFLYAESAYWPNTTLVIIPFNVH